MVFSSNELTLINLCFSSEKGISLSEKLTDCYRQFAEDAQGNEKQSVIRQTIFISARSDSEYIQNKQKLLACAKIFFGELPPTSVIAQSPGDESLVVEIVCMAGLKSGEPKIKSNSKSSWLVIERDNLKIVLASGLSENENSKSILQQSVSAFEDVKNILLEEEMEFSDIVRQWNYIERITGIIDPDNLKSQHYQIFNDVRTKFYKQANFLNGFPAATGIGMDFGGISIDFIAAKFNDKNSIISLKSPVQLDAYSYSEEVLAENSFMRDFCRTTPKFERAKIISTPSGKWVFISGTAAIIGQNSDSQRSVEHQTEMTIRNIKSLISPENLQKHGIGSTAEVNINYLRAYVKFGNDLPQVKEICRNYFPQIPISFVVADICRPELLVEIEGHAEIVHANTFQA